MQSSVMISIANLRLLVEVSIFEKVKVTNVKLFTYAYPTPVRLTSAPTVVSNLSDSAILL